jgi:hypothetical protein
MFSSWVGCWNASGHDAIGQYGGVLQTRFVMADAEVHDRCLMAN